MAIVQLSTFDIDTAQPWALLASNGFWASLPRLSRCSPNAKLLMVADTLRLEAIQEGFHQVAVPEEGLPRGVQIMRMQYEDFLRQAIEETRYIRSYLVTDTTLGEEALCNLLGAYGVPASPLDHPLPLPFQRGVDEWSHVRATDGRLFGLLRSKTSQFGAIYPRSLHRLFTLDWPVWASLQITTFTERDALRLLRYKSTVARYSERKTSEQAAEAAEVESTIGRLRAEMHRAGALLHTVRLHVMVAGLTAQELQERMEVTRGSLPFDMERVYPPGDSLRRVFSASAVAPADGSLLTSPGVALLVGSALSYRRRTETRGVLLGVDRNQAPVIFNVFDPRNPSYNMVILGQTGSGKTFAALLLMLRHLQLGARLVIIDPQGNVDLSFLGKDVVHKAVLGTGPSAINVLDITQEEMGAQVETVCSMLSLLGVLRRSDSLARSLLDEILLDIYEPLWNLPQRTPPTLAAVQRRLAAATGQARIPAVRQAAEMLAYMLGPYTAGSYASLFGKQTAVDFSLDRPVTIYDVSALPQQELGGNLRSALLSILVSDVNQAIRRRRSAGDTAPILFFVDEMGMLMRDPVIASHVSKEYKTARARRVGMIVADQDLHSLLGPQDASGLHHGEPILANAAFKLLFYQEGSERERVRNAFPGLPQAMFESIFSFGRGACLAQLPDDLLVVDVRPSHFERVVLSSQLHDRERAQKVIRRIMEEVS